MLILFISSKVSHDTNVLQIILFYTCSIIFSIYMIRKCNYALGAVQGNQQQQQIKQHYVVKWDSCRSNGGKDLQEQPKELKDGRSDTLEATKILIAWKGCRLALHMILLLRKNPKTDLILNKVWSQRAGLIWHKRVKKLLLEAKKCEEESVQTSRKLGRPPKNPAKTAKNTSKAGKSLNIVTVM
ncbi:hypothetical protein VNO80_19338 [Phaseolus coccineus]|uniref:Uncharacterized protein n=1 Tax=Phaseolus coccineus TaxID=3886 RepID=A0AAN9QX85_PHACN